MGLTPSRDEVKRDLEPYFDTIASCIREAVNEYHKLDDAQRAIFLKRTRANIINDNIIHHLERALSGDPDVRFVRNSGDVRVIMRDRYKLKAKLLTRRNLRARNVPTQRSWDFRNQNGARQLQLFDTPPIINLFAGYTWNELETDIEGIYLVCPNGRTNHWHIELTIPAEPVLLPSLAGDEEALMPRVVVPKASSLKRNVQGDGVRNA